MIYCFIKFKFFYKIHFNIFRTVSTANKDIQLILQRIPITYEFDITEPDNT